MALHQLLCGMISLAATASEHLCMRPALPADCSRDCQASLALFGWRVVGSGVILTSQGHWRWQRVSWARDPVHSFDVPLQQLSSLQAQHWREGGHKQECARLASSKQAA